MRDALDLPGVILKVQPYKEFDKRLVILTGERGLITAFARGARRQTSPLLAAANPFVFGRFSLYEGKNAYTLAGVSVVDYFDGITRLSPGIYYGFYFLELAGYFAQEEQEARSVVDLIYVTLKALMKDMLPLPLIRAVFELRLLKENGLYAPPDERGTLNESAFYALRFVCEVPLQKLYAFNLSEEAMRDFKREVTKHLNRQVEGTLKSLMFIDED